MPPQLQSTTALIALDWGTSSLRAYRFDQQGKLTDKRSLPWGIMNLPAAESVTAASEASDTTADAGFRRALQAACGDWLQDSPGAPLIAAGMIGSKQGWREVPYLEVPLAVADIGKTLTAVEAGVGTMQRVVHIVPGLLQRSALPNVMRGEETQVAGIVDHLQVDDILIGLPGTHSKWVHVRDRRITHFDTFMTGEMYAALSGHTILGRTMQRDGRPDDAAFLRGAGVAGTAAGRAGMLSTMFSCRTLGLTGELSPGAQADYLSGLLIGHEIAALLTLPPFIDGSLPSSQRIALIGDEALCQRYQRVLALYGVAQADIAAAATEHGLWTLARHAGLIA